MGRRQLWALLLVVVAGCSSLGGGLSQEDRAWVQAEVQKAYARGVQDGFTARPTLREAYEPYYRWAEPVVQVVHEPAHVEGGAYHPAQDRWVVLKPGEWRRDVNVPLGALSGAAQPATK